MGGVFDVRRWNIAEENIIILTEQFRNQSRLG
jgi:hypothetical protein